MLLRLFIIFGGVIAFDLWLLVELGKNYGIGPTILVVLGTGFFGIVLVKSQGIFLLYQSRHELMHGRMPARELLNGAILLVGAVFLIVPGLLTDVIGLLLVFPSTRRFGVSFIGRYLQKKTYNGILVKLFSRGRGKN